MLRQIFVVTSGGFALLRLKDFMTEKNLITVYYALVYPYLNYGVSLWGQQNCHITEKNN